MSVTIFETPTQIIARLEAEKQDLSMQVQSLMVVLWTVLDKTGGKFTISKLDMASRPEEIGLRVIPQPDGGFQYLSENLDTKKVIEAEAVSEEILDTPQPSESEEVLPGPCKE